MLGELVPCGGGDPIPLLKPNLMIGRRSRCDIALPFANISSHHCHLELINGYWHVRDLGSRNGVKVNGVRVDQKWLLPHDVLGIAKHRFEIVYTPQTDGPPPEEEDPFALSLLEKAGLEHQREYRPRRSNGAPPPQRTPAPPPDGPLGDDDIALSYLNEE